MSAKSADNGFHSPLSMQFANCESRVSPSHSGTIHNNNATKRCNAKFQLNEKHILSIHSLLIHSTSKTHCLPRRMSYKKSVIEGFANLNLSQNDNDEDDDLVALCRKKIQNSEFFPKWVSLLGNKLPTESTYLPIYSTISTKLDDFETERKADTAKEVRHNAVEILADSCTLTFVAVELQKENVNQLVYDLEDKVDQYLLEEGYIDTEYHTGFIYILRLLKAFVALREIKTGKDSGDINPEFRKWMEDGLDKKYGFDKLSKKGKAAVYCVKQTFMGDVDRSAYDVQISVLEEMTQLDPDQYLWHLELHYILKYKRRTSGVRDDPPSDRETRCILHAVKLSENKNPAVVVAKCACFAAKVRATRGKGPFNFGDGYDYETAKEVVSHLKDECRAALVLDPISTKVNITIAEIFSVVLLPPYLRDVGFAKECIERSLVYHPNSSKANTRMGVHYLTEEKNAEEAQKYFEKALSADKRNFPAIMLLLQTCMANPAKNKDFIVETIQKELSGEDGSRWGSDKMATLLMQKAFLQIMMEDEATLVLQSFTEALEYYEESVKFGLEKLPYFINRYGWKHVKLEYSEILEILNSVEGLSRREEGFRGKLVILVQSVWDKNMEDEEKRRLNREATRGRGGYRGGSSDFNASSFSRGGNYCGRGRGARGGEGADGRPSRGGFSRGRVSNSSSGEGNWR
ncbi:uncharacterized protein LOC110849754 [Folsomia candida]|uniref:uncharacterized protein LOC110849754 n=1 Tax=Folsomia candida TaxID=158441 RepID=UPI0016054D40|nr:uncharacterized protein LOC110849754 [Folsomia candida]